MRYQPGDADCTLQLSQATLGAAARKGERVVANMARPPATPGGPQLAGTPSGVQTKEDLLRQAADLAVAARAASLEAQAEAKARLKAKQRQSLDKHELQNSDYFRVLMLSGGSASFADSQSAALCARCWRSAVMSRSAI